MRTCYDHLARKLAVNMARAFESWVVLIVRGERDYVQLRRERNFWRNGRFTAVPCGDEALRDAASTGRSVAIILPGRWARQSVRGFLSSDGLRVTPQQPHGSWDAGGSITVLQSLLHSPPPLTSRKTDAICPPILESMDEARLSTHRITIDPGQSS
jgi:hypothetical protein